MDRKLTAGRLVIAVITTSVEEAAIYSIWRWLLPDLGVRLPVAALLAVMAAWLAFSVWLFIFTTRFLKRQPSPGLPSMVGTAGRAASLISPEGMVNIRGELWVAISTEGKIRSGEKIVVVGQEGLKLKVQRAESAPGSPSTGSG
jgi:membrane-bound ClpP family serine protease